MQIHINRDGQDFGPYSLDQVHQYLQDGSIVASDMAWYDGAPDWMPLPKVPGVKVPAGAAAAGGAGKKTVVWISIAAVAAAAITGAIVFVVMNKGDGKPSQSAQGASGESGGESESGSNDSGSGSSSGMDGGMDMGMDGGDMGMAMGMDMGMDGGMDMGMGGGGVDVGKVHALLEQKCFKCHGNGKSKGKYSLEKRASAMEHITPGNPGNSRIMELIRRGDEDDAMPPKAADKLSPAEVAMIANWIKAGAKW